MAQVIFYEKPGCINNTRQKKRLRNAGHTVVAKNLLTEDWGTNPDHLRAFFDGKPVSEWFNRSAPLIKRGAIDPEALDEQQAIELMVIEPLLIRRPLMQVGGEKMVGFDEIKVDAWIGLSELDGEQLELCPRHRQPDCSHG